MYNNRVKRKYWDNRMEEYAKEFAITDNPLRQEILYKKLFPKLRTLTESTLVIYINNYNYSEQSHLILDAIDNALVELRNYYDPKRAKAFSFLGTTIKHRLMDNCFGMDKYPKHKFDKSMIRFEEFPEFVDSVTDAENTYSYEMEQEAILKRFKTFLKEAIEDYHPKSNYHHPTEKTIKERRIEYMRFAIEYGEKFGVDNFLNMNSYIQNKMNISDYNVSLLSTHFFGRGSSPRSNDYHLATKDNKTNVSSVINDDFTPDVSKSMIFVKRSKIKKKIDNRFIFY